MSSSFYSVISMEGRQFRISAYDVAFDGGIVFWGRVFAGFDDEDVFKVALDARGVLEDGRILEVVVEMWFGRNS